MIIKKISLLVTSIISLFIFIFFLLVNSNAEENNSKRYSEDEGVLSIMYHRFNEMKYPSTNIKIQIFREHIKLIENSNFTFYNPIEFQENFNKPKNQKKILLTIDDGFKTFYNEAWPILKKKKNPFYIVCIY